MGQVNATLAYNQGRDQGRADEARRAGALAANPVERFLGGSSALTIQEQAAEIATLREQTLELKQRLHAVRAIRDTLKNALREAAPDHPLINPFAQNPILGAIAEEAASKVTDDTGI